MLTTLIVCLCLATNLHAEHSITSSSSQTSISTATNAAPVDSRNLSAESNAASFTPSPPSLFIIDDKLAKIAASCLTNPDHEQRGYRFKAWYARIFTGHLIREADAMIGLEELRAALGFAPPGNWTKHRQPPSEEELAAAPTVEAYYELREPRSEDSSLDSEFFFEHNFPPVFAFLEKRFPTIRQIFRRKFEESLGAGGSIDRTVVDHMIDEYLAILDRVNNAMFVMRSRTNECEHSVLMTFKARTTAQHTNSLEYNGLSFVLLSKKNGLDQNTVKRPPRLVHLCATVIPIFMSIHCFKKIYSELK